MDKVELMQRQQCLDDPAMSSETRGHRRCGPALGLGQAPVRCAEIIARPDQMHTML